jgi:hypothetical protein
MLVMEPEETIWSAAGIRHRLRVLELERMVADEAGLTRCGRMYRRDLEEEIAETQALFVVAAVAEIAVLRAQLSGRQVG